MPSIVRGVASASISSCLKFMPTTGVAIGAGDSADDLHRFGDARGAHRHVLLDGQSERHGGRPHDGREAVQFEPDLVVARRQRPHHVEPL